MNYTLHLDKILAVARSLAAMQVLADDCGDGAKNHPLSALLDDYRRPVLRRLALQSFVEISMRFRRYFDDLVLPEPDAEFDSFFFSVDSRMGIVEYDLLLAAMEQAVALDMVVTTLRVDDSHAAAVAAFTTLREQYVTQALKMLAPPFPDAVTPLY